MDRIVTIDRLGRLVIPKDLRHQLHLRGGSRLRLRAEGAYRMVLEPVEDGEGLAEQGGLLVATGEVRGDWVDHRDLRENRHRRLAGRG